MHMNDDSKRGSPLPVNRASYDKLAAGRLFYCDFFTGVFLSEDFFVVFYVFFVGALLAADLYLYSLYL